VEIFSPISGNSAYSDEIEANFSLIHNDRSTAQQLHVFEAFANSIGVG